MAIVLLLGVVLLPVKTSAYGFVIEDSTRTPGPWTYANEDNVNNFPNGTWFSGVITDHAVLQRGAVSAALYGGVGGGVSANAEVTLTVAEKGSDSYTVAAQIISINQKAGNLTWKALLKPRMNQGGSINITAKCNSCTNTTAAKIIDITFGDVW